MPEDRPDREIGGPDRLAATHAPTSQAPSTTSAQLPLFVPGQLLAERYRIARRVGRGGMGEVYEAEDQELSIQIALKTLLVADAGKQAALRRFKQEVLLARSVAHPHVCRVYDIGRHDEGTDSVLFLTMELLRGETLSALLQRQNKLLPAQALPLARQIASGIAAAHRTGVVHRDLKSDNVMLVDDGGATRAIITDFGIAQMIAPADRQSSAVQQGKEAIVGTPAYMAPEQLIGGEIGPAADIYALGVVLFEMMTGSLPFGGTPQEVIQRKLREDAPSPRSITPELDERWNTVISRCLSREPGARFARPADVIAELEGDAPGTTVEVAGVTTVRSHQHNLPAERDTLVGRETDLMALEARINDRSRIVTLQGTAGMGKSRLSIRFAWHSLKTWPGGAWLCDLTEAKDAHDITAVVAHALDVPLGRGDAVDQLGHAIANRGRCLILLDNVDSVVADAASIIGQWLERAPEVRFVVTSRQRLNLVDEEILALEPLSVDSGIQLFVDRARKLHPGFAAEAPVSAAIKDVVQLTDRIPLAIELAAARLRVMSPAQLAARMRERFKVLAGSIGGRHATLRAAIDLSWDLLHPWEKAALAQLAVFEGGFTLDAAEAVLHLDPWPEAPWVVDVVQSLVDKSLLQSWMPGDDPSLGIAEVRFGMYMSIQEYARGKLLESGAAPAGGSGEEAGRAAETRHGEWYARHGSDEEMEALHRRAGTEQRRRLAREFENLVAACRRAVTRANGEMAAATYRAVWAVIELRGPFGKAVELGREVLAAPLVEQTRARVLATLGEAEARAGSMVEARDHQQSALDIHRQAGDQRLEGIALGRLGNLLHALGQSREARAFYNEALAIHRAVGNRPLEGMLLGQLGNIELEEGHTNEARERYEAALAIHREVGNRRFEGTVLGNLANLCLEQARMNEALTLYEEALGIHRVVGNRLSEGFVLGNLGLLLSEQGRMEEALTHFDAALTIAREVGNRLSEGVVLGNLGNLYLEQGKLERAGDHYKRALAIHREVRNRRFEGIVLGHLGGLSRERGQLADAREHYEEALLIHREVGNRRFEGVVLGDLGRLCLDLSEYPEAEEHLQAALGVLREVDDRRSEGCLLGVLSRLYVQQGNLEQARDAILRGESLLWEVGDRVERGKLLCTRAELELRDGYETAARSTLAEVENLAAQVGAKPGSDLGRRMDQVRRLLGADS